ncbi:T9SS type A sorting domain-containing protein [Fibrobacter sp. UBA4309]|uniref:T9SS type A sorting domain-containing protein n=1 Tax=Fibrobacter sp. UBA4309 TaxID=1946537 RepID=UPI0025C4C4EA|nr:T9SS type A sorting domain-containing protein [Fibrobacter sp. UBA4309]
MKMLTKISTMVAFACVCSAMAAVQTNDAKKLSRDKHGSYSRLMRVTMKDGSTEEFLMESVKNLTFAANPNDSSDIDEKPPVEDPELPDVPDRTPEARSMSSSATESSSSDKFDPEVKSSDSESSDSKSSDSKQADDKSSSSAKSSDSKSSDKSSSSSVKQSSSSETTDGIPMIDYAGTRIMWSPKKQTLSVFSRQAGNAKFSLFDAQGVNVGGGSMYVSRGSTSLSLEYLNLPKGTFVIRFEIGNTKLQQKISVTGK